MGVTAKSIADNLHLSASAVSLALNGKAGVSESTRQLVLAEAEKLGYKQKETPAKAGQNICFIIFLGLKEEVINETSFYSYVLQGLEMSARSFGYNVLVKYIKIGNQPSAIPADLLENTAGVVLLGTILSKINLPQLRSLFNLQVPVVMVDNCIEDLHVDSIVSDNMRGVYKATKHLLQKGCSSLGYVRSKVTIDNFTERQKGFFKACGEARNLPKPILIDIDISSQKAFEDMDQWLNAGNVPPAGIIADNDVLAIACMRALKAHSYRIPQDVSIIGFDNMPICAMADPPLSAIAINQKFMGETAMITLHNRILKQQSGDGSSSADSSDTLRIYISSSLIERESS